MTGSLYTLNFQKTKIIQIILLEQSVLKSITLFSNMFYKMNAYLQFYCERNNKNNKCRSDAKVFYNCQTHMHDCMYMTFHTVDEGHPK